MRVAVLQSALPVIVLSACGPAAGRITPNAPPAVDVVRYATVWNSHCEYERDSLVPTLEITGRVIDDSTQAPVDRVAVSIVGTECRVSTHGGRFRIPVPQPGSYRVRIDNLDLARGPLYTPREVGLLVSAMGATFPTELHVDPLPCVADTPSVRLAGVLVDATNGYTVGRGSEVQIRAAGCRSVTDSTAHWAIFGAPSGRVTLHVRAFGYMPMDTTLRVRRAHGAVRIVVIMIRPAPSDGSPSF